MAYLIERRCATVSSLTEIKDVCDTDAERIRAVFYAGSSPEVRKVYPSARPRNTDENFSEYKRAVINTILGTMGVEFLGIHRTQGGSVYYCNAGDMYATTVLFYGAFTLRVGCIADLIEKNKIRPLVPY
jgi:hypothetical protein